MLDLPTGVVQRRDTGSPVIVQVSSEELAAGPLRPVLDVSPAARQQDKSGALLPVGESESPLAAPRWRATPFSRTTAAAVGGGAVTSGKKTLSWGSVIQKYTCTSSSGIVPKTITYVALRARMTREAP